MKKMTLISLLVTSFACSGIALADGFTGNSQANTTHYTGPSNTAAKAMTIKQAKSMSDDTYVTLRGKITQHIKGDKYMLQDSTDQIVIEVDDDLWYGLTVSPTDTVEIIGEVDKDSPWGKVDIDVKNIKKI